MIRKIIKIDSDKCNGCGLCAEACHEAAIAMVDGKAKLIRDDYCDGLGNCLPACPTGAISFEEREAADYNETAVKANQMQKAEKNAASAHTAHAVAMHATGSDSQNTSELRQWPIQIKLVPVKAPYFEDARLLIAADCAAYACGDFHNKFMRGKVTLIGCPKLDNVDYSEKLNAIIAGNAIKSVTVIRMEVPCCGGIEHAAIAALKSSGKFLPWQVLTLSINGEVLE